MKTFVMKYPGDPPATVEHMTLEEFFIRFSPESRKVAIGPLEGPPDVSYHLGNMVLCDMCNADISLSSCQGTDPGDSIYLVGNSRAYCQKCFDRSIKKYCKDETENRLV